MRYARAASGQIRIIRVICTVIKKIFGVLCYLKNAEKVYLFDKCKRYTRSIVVDDALKLFEYSPTFEGPRPPFRYESLGNTNYHSYRLL